MYSTATADWLIRYSNLILIHDYITLMILSIRCSTVMVNEFIDQDMLCNSMGMVATSMLIGVMYHLHQIYMVYARGVVVIVVGNGHGDTSSNSGRD